MEKQDTPVLDLITFYALDGQYSRGYHVMAWVKTKHPNGDVELAPGKQTWCRSCAIVEAFYFDGRTGGGPHTQLDLLDLLGRLVGDGTVLPCIQSLTQQGHCALCQKYFGDMPIVKTRTTHPHHNDTWRKKNRRRIR